MSLKAREALGFSRPTVRPRCVVADSDEVEWCVCVGGHIICGICLDRWNMMYV